MELGFESKDQYMLQQIAMSSEVTAIHASKARAKDEGFYVSDHHPLKIPMRIRKPKMPAMRRVTSRGEDSTVHLLNLAVADSTYANKDSRDSMNCSFNDSNLSPGEPLEK